MFTDDHAVVDAVAAVMPILALMQFPGGAAYLLDGVLMGNNDFATARWSTLAGLVAFAGPAIAVLVRPHWGCARCGLASRRGWWPALGERDRFAP